MKKLWTILALATLLAGAISVPASAQDAAVVARLETHGRMPNRPARDLVRRISAKLAENAQRGGNDYDRIRQAVGEALFGTGSGGGPGRTPEEFRTRMDQVLAELRGGLDEQLLQAIFRARTNAAVLCAQEFAVTMNECDALVAAASGEQAALPYIPPDDGRALKRTLERARVRGRVAKTIVSSLRSTMLGVPRSLANDARGRGVLELLESCPGGLSSRESQIRAWHVGPTEGMAQCIGQALVERVGPARAAAEAQARLGMNAAGAEAFVRWAAPSAMSAGAGSGQQQPTTTTTTTTTTTATTGTATGPAGGGNVDQVLAAARGHFQAGRFAEAAAAYEQATRMDPARASIWAGLGGARLRRGDARGAIAAYEQAIRIDGRVANLHAFLGDAYRTAGDRNRAADAYRRALGIDARHAGAAAGLQAMGMPATAQQTQPTTTTTTTTTTTASTGTATAGGGAAAVTRWLEQARTHYRERRYPQAAVAYETAASLDPNNAGAQAGLGACRVALGDAAGAVTAYQQAVRLAPTQSGYLSALGRAQMTLGDRDGAIESFRRALQLDANNAVAREGLARLGVAPGGPVAGGPPPGGPGGPPPGGPIGPPPGGPGGPPPGGEQLPEVPSRDQILNAMRPLQGGVNGCAPAFDGVVNFRLTVEGATGNIREAVLEGDMAATPEGECMVGVVRGAQFPRFTRETLQIAYPFRI